jgi:dihydroorotate dehydrogenase
MRCCGSAGFVEIGTVTPEAATGNPRPRCSGWSATKP